jgi:tetratricopeptide (TPR) repeat protein
LIIPTDVGKALILATRYDEAIAHLTNVLEVDSHFGPARYWITLAHGLKGDYYTEEKLEALRSLPDDDTGRLKELVNIYAMTGQMTRARASLARLVALSKQTYVSPLFLALAYQSLGDLDNGFLWLNRVCDERTTGVIGFKVDPEFDRFRADPRFTDILRRVGFAK